MQKPGEGVPRLQSDPGSSADRDPVPSLATRHFPVSFPLPLYPQAIAPSGASRHHWQDAPNRFSGAARLSTAQVQTGMATINRQELDRLERRELQLTIMAAVFVFVLASGLAVFMYPLVFVHPDVPNKWTLRVAFFGFCALTLLFIGYLLGRPSTVPTLKRKILAEVEPHIENPLQARAAPLPTL